MGAAGGDRIADRIDQRGQEYPWNQGKCKACHSPDDRGIKRRVAVTHCGAQASDKADRYQRHDQIE